MVKYLILFGGIFVLFYVLSFFARVETDITYWATVALLGVFSRAIKAYILKEDFEDFTSYEEVSKDDKRSMLQAVVFNGLVVVVLLGYLLVNYFIEV